MRMISRKNNKIKKKQQKEKEDDKIPRENNKLWRARVVWAPVDDKHLQACLSRF